MRPWWVDQESVRNSPVWVGRINRTEVVDALALMRTCLYTPQVSPEALKELQPLNALAEQRYYTPNSHLLIHTPGVPRGAQGAAALHRPGAVPGPCRCGAGARQGVQRSQHHLHLAKVGSGAAMRCTANTHVNTHAPAVGITYTSPRWAAAQLCAAPLTHMHLQSASHTPRQGGQRRSHVRWTIKTRATANCTTRLHHLYASYAPRFA